MRNSTPDRERLILECILWKFATDIPWYDLPEAYPLLPARPAKGNYDPPPSYQTIYRRCRKWRKSGLLLQVLSTLNSDLKIRGGFDLPAALSSGSIHLELNRKRSWNVSLQPDLKNTWQLRTALLLLSIAARQI